MKICLLWLRLSRNIKFDRAYVLVFAYLRGKEERRRGRERERCRKNVAVEKEWHESLIYGTGGRQLWQRTAVIENPVGPSNLLIGAITYARHIF